MTTQYLGYASGTNAAFLDGGPINVKGEPYNAAGDGVANDTTALADAIADAHAAGTAIYLPPGTYLTDPIALDATNCPTGIIGEMSTIEARSSSVEPLLTLENVHTFVVGFRMRNLNLAAASKHANWLKIAGGQFYDLENVYGAGSTGDGMVVAGASAAGVYYSRFSHVRSYGAGGVGFSVKSTGSANYIASNTWLMCAAEQCTSYGLDIDWASGCYVGFEAEFNGTTAVNIDNTYDAGFFGGYSEFNGTPDTSFTLTANSTGVKIVGGRHIGALSGTLTGVGNVFMATRSTPQLAAMGVLGNVGFYGTTPIAQQTLATGASHTVDDVITALQNLGLVKQ